MNSSSPESQLDGVAVIGIAGRFPGARNPNELWQNVRNGIESISRLSSEELDVRDRTTKVCDPDYIRARGILEDADLFDAGFFDIYPKEAELMDPQHRIFLECCWEALEDAGHNPLRIPELTGVFAGCSQNSYFLTQVCEGPTFLRDYAEAYQSGYFPTLMATIPDTLSTRVAYKLNLQGPCMTLSCACSTSLVAVSQAFNSLVGYQCDMALAGGVSVSFPQRRGYTYQTGAMVSPDGRCRSFDADAAGTVFGAGAGVVVLKRLDEALRDRDHIYAIIRGAAVNNDGNRKAGFTAPGVEGQAKVIAMAQAVAGVDPRTVTYIEAHGTATPLGDPIEVEALTQVFRESTSDSGFCALGTVKTNVGHLDIASGITGLIKAALSLKHKQLTPTLHFRRPNPNLRLESSPFYVNTELRDWESPEGQARRAGVSAFGLGGTNCHVVLEEAPTAGNSSQSRPHQILVVSAKSAEALKQARKRLAEHLQKYPELNLSDAAFTLLTGRSHFPFRSVVSCRNSGEAVLALGKLDISADAVKSCQAQSPIYFLFPGQGSQYPGMGQQIYIAEPRFRKAVDECAEILKPRLGIDIREVIFAGSALDDDGRNEFDHTRHAQPAIFTIEYALARLWMHWGIQPAGMIGHSVGEFTCACIAGTLSLEDVLTVIAERAVMMSAIEEGAMLAVRLSESELSPLLGTALSLAAVNAPNLSVAAGPAAAIKSLEERLGEKGVASTRLRTSHAFHSRMMDPILAPLGETLKGVKLNPPGIPWVSCVTGDWITEALAMDPNYWTNHCRKTVRFADAVRRLHGIGRSLFLEVGPGATLQTLVKQSLPRDSDHLVVSSLFDPRGQAGSEPRQLIESLGQIWAAGGQPDWDSYFEAETHNRVPLPTYPFERQRFWIEQPETEPTESAPERVAREISDEGEKMPAQGTTSSYQGRKEQLVVELTDVLQDLSGLDSSLLDSGVSFLELGLDSLFLTQLSQAIQSRFGVKVTFRQLLAEMRSITEVAAYLAEEMPQSAAPVKEVVASADILPSSVLREAERPGALPAGFQTGTGRSAIERIIDEQLQTMSKLMADQLAAIASCNAPSTGAESVSAVPMNGGTTSGKPANSLAAVEPGHPPKDQVLEKKTYQPYKPIETGPRGELTPAQRSYLDRLISRYVKRTAESKRLTQKYRRVLADPRVVSGFRSQWKEMIYPITVRRSQGSRLWDVDGNEYIDLVNGFGPIAFGHRPRFIADAVAAQLEEGIEIGPQTPLAGEVAELLCELTGMERATFCNTGSEAVMAAIRLARTVTGRSKIVLFAGDYHGNYEEVLVKRTGRDGSLRSGPIAPGISAEAVANVIVLDYGTDEALRVIREHAAELAAVLVEPVQSRHPELQPREFLLEVRDITHSSGTALIFDEIVTGFRVHQGGAQALYGIRADMATYGKILGGGLPIGAVAGRAAFMDALDGGMWKYGDDSYPEAGVTFFAGTFVRHPLAMASALAVLRHIKESGPALQQELTFRTRRLTERLKEIFIEFGIPAKIESCGSWFYWSFPNDFQFGSLFYFHLREKGIHILEGFPCFLTTAHSDADLTDVEGAFEETCREMRAGGMLPELAATFVKEGPPRFKEANLTESQMEIWLSSQLSVEAACAYNESVSVHLRGELNQRALCDGLRQVVGRHDALRVRFDPAAPGMILSDSPGLEISRLDFTSAELNRREDLLSDTIKGEAETPFDLTVAPAVRAVLVRLDLTHHVLIFTAHHIVCDGWSVNVILEELGKIYSAICGVARPLSEPYSFLQYAHDLKRDASKPAMVEVARYWLTKFAEATPALDLPVDRPRPPVKSYAGSTCRRRVDSDTCGKIKREAARHGATLTAMLLAGFQALLMRLTGQDDVVVGIPSAGQSLLEGETLVGHCVNFLPLRARLAEGTTFAGLLSQTRQSLLDAYENRTYTFGTLVNRLGMKRDPSRLPLIEVQFNLERIADNVEFAGLKVDVEANPKSAVNFDLFLNVVESRHGLVLDCDYNSDLFDRSTVERWLSHYVVLLVAASEKIEQSVAELPLLEDSERRRLIMERNGTYADYPRDLRIDQLVDHKAAMTPTSIAVVFEDRSLTFEQLSQRSNRLARYLVRRGVHACEKVAVVIERSLALPEALLAILKCGAAYVPLDPAMPRERIRTILDESNASIILTNHTELATLSPTEARLICLDVESVSIANESPAPFGREADSAATAYVIFTSGSTGKPKGVEVTHRSVVNLLWSMAAEPGIVPSDRLLAVTTLSFDIAGLEILLPLVTGARLVIASREATMDGFVLARSIRDFGITMLQATPSTWRILLEAGWEPDPKVKMLCGGEAIPRQLAETLLENNASLWNMYGPTETTIWSAASKVSRGSGFVPIGLPIANTQFYVLDRAGQVCPLGVAGELHIGGDGVAVGYFGRPDLTASSFITDPFAATPGAKMYKTGDLMRALPGGQIEFLGRLDNQVKLRGYRIELGEIESTILHYPGIREVAVILVQLKPGDDRLVAYVAAEETRMPAIADLRQHIASRLPGYMIPSHFVRMDELPRTSNGKLARKALPKLDSTDFPACREHSLPANPAQRKLTDICREVLQVNQLGVEDDLFELGADSIRIFQIASRAASAGLAITALSLLKGRNVAAACALAQPDSTQTPDGMRIRVGRHSRERYIVTAAAASR